MSPVARIALLLTYAVLFLAAAGRSSVELSTKASQAPLAYSLSAVAAALYGLIAFALWRGGPGWRRVAVVGTAFELVGVLVVGTLGYVDRALWPEHTVWSGYGSGYGWIPLVLPVVALWALLRSGRARTPAA